MKNNSDLIELVYELLEGVKSPDNSTQFKLQESLKLIRTESPFLYSYLRDSLEVLEDAVTKQNVQKIETISEVILTRLSYFGNWLPEKNKTISLITDGTIQSDEIKPFIRLSSQAYEDFYINQNKLLKEKLKEKVFDDNSKKRYVPIEINKNINHVLRKTYAVNIIETLIGIFNQVGVENGRWLDVGCGVGYIVNAVNQEIYPSGKWVFQGCDLQENRIKFAKANSAANRKYTCENAFSVIKDLNDKGEKPNIISMFEFCEHFEDPAHLIQSVSKLSVDAIVIGTPLMQKHFAPMDNTPDPVHLWGFTRVSMEKIIKSTGFEVLLTSENRVGHYNTGLDWLTVVAVTPKIKNKINAKFVPQNN